MGENLPSEQKYALILYNAPVGIVEIRDDGEIVSPNRLGRQLLELIAGRPVEAGSDCFSILSILNEDIEEHIRNFDKPEGVIIDNLLCSFKISEGEKHFSVTATKTFADCIVVSIDDVTTRRNEERALQLAEQEKAVAEGKYEIISEVLHDIGNAIVGFTSHLTRINRTLEGSGVENLEKLAAYLQLNEPALATALSSHKASALVSMTTAINQSVKNGINEVTGSVSEQLRIITHIQDILDIQRQYVRGHQSRERKAVNLKEVIRDCAAMVSANLEKKGIELVMSLPAEGTYIKGDRTKLMQVVLNLLKNSADAIEADFKIKEIHLSLSVEEKIKLKIADSGKGFDESAGAMLFKRGYTTKGKGTGIGLNASRSIIESHDGTITMESKGPGKGCKTTIEFNR